MASRAGWCKAHKNWASTIKNSASCERTKGRARTAVETKWRRGVRGEFAGGIQHNASSEVINLIRWRSHILFFLSLYVSLIQETVKGRRKEYLKAPKLRAAGKTWHRPLVMCVSVHCVLACLGPLYACPLGTKGFKLVWRRFTFSQSLLARRTQLGQWQDLDVTTSQMGMLSFILCPLPSKAHACGCKGLTHILPNQCVKA